MLYPVPAVMISCGKKGEQPNIITVAWAGTICSDPAMVSISVRSERFSHGIISETGEFVINLVNKNLTYAADFCGVRSGRNTDKFAEMKLTAAPCEKLDTVRIDESPVNIECRVKDIIKLGTHDMFLAEVVNVTIDDKYMDETGRFHLNSTGLVAYSHGEYFTLGEKIGKFGYSVQKKNKARKK